MIAWVARTITCRPGSNSVELGGGEDQLKLHREDLLLTAMPRQQRSAGGIGRVPCVPESACLLGCLSAQKGGGTSCCWDLHRIPFRRGTSSRGACKPCLTWAAAEPTIQDRYVNLKGAQGPQANLSTAAKALNKCAKSRRYRAPCAEPMAGVPWRPSKRERTT